MKKLTGDSQTITAWSFTVAIWLAGIFLFGGVTGPRGLHLAVLAGSSALLALVGLWRLRAGLPTMAAAVGLILAGLVLFLFLLQLVPLPAAFHSSLPGRADLERVLTDIGVESVARPLSLAPGATVASLLGVIPGFAAFVAALTLGRREYATVGLAICLLALFSSLLALLQRQLPVDSWLHFFGASNRNAVAAMFENRNFLATQLAASVPFIAALAMMARSAFGLQNWVIVLFTLAYGAVVLAGLAMSGSRFGVILAMASVFLTVLFVYRPTSAGGAQTKTALQFAGLPLLIVGVFFIMSQASMIGLLRLAQRDPLEDYRNTIYFNTVSAIKNYFPWGSGFGSFVPVYKLHETPESLIPNYVNAAHSDWLQVGLEGGLPAMVLVAGFILLALVALFRIVTLPSNVAANAFSRAAAVALLLMVVHAAVDYPLRTVSLFAFAAFCLGIMVSAGQSSPWEAERPARREPPSRRVPPSRGSGPAQSLPPGPRPKPSFARPGTGGAPTSESTQFAASAPSVKDTQEHD